IENIIEGREPSFGYVVLANLMANNYINTIITTNFDDLVYSACTTFTGIRPIVYAYGVMASEMRMTAQRPKILKLHGDFLYSAIKNTGAEIAAQDPNMERQLRQVLSEYGLIVVGYSGGDESVMKILGQISERNDLYWCLRRGEEPNDAVKQLLSDKGGFIVEIEGFDEMMNEIRRIVEFDVPKMVGSIQERQNQMIEQFKKFEPQYSADILGEIAGALKESPVKEDDNKNIQALEFFSQAYKVQKAGDLSKAEELYRKTIELSPKDANIYVNLGALLKATGRRTEAEVAWRKAIELNPNDPTAYNNLGTLLDDTEHMDEAEAAYRKAIELNPNYPAAYNNFISFLREQNRAPEAMILAERALQLDSKNQHLPLNLMSLHKKFGQRAEARQYAAQAREIIKSDDWYNLACLESICENTEAAIENLRRAAQADSFNPKWVRRDPDLEWIRDDPRFKEIVGEENA
ncbi:MAG: hypothetical protein DMF68_10420, partial [Acidobacteria bacterium]